MTRLIFDIETGPLPPERLRELLTPFDVTTVKTGNLKDPAKIAEKIAEAEANHLTDFLDGAALDARFGQVLAVGFIEDGVCEIVTGDEADILDRSLHKIKAALVTQSVVGFNIKSFDLPFMLRRAWGVGVKMPYGIKSMWKGRHQWNDNLIDLRHVWQLGDYQARGTLDSIAKHLGLPGKTGSGKDFARLFAEDREAALDYLRNDLVTTQNVADSML